MTLPAVNDVSGIEFPLKLQPTPNVIALIEKYGGGRAFVGPLPFTLGTNGHMITAGTVDTVGVTYAQSIGMKVYRNDVPWSGVPGTPAVIEGLPGTYNATNIGYVSTIVAAMKADGFTPLVVVTINSTNTSIGLCPTLKTALVIGDVYTAINVGNANAPTNYAITAGDTITLTNPANQSQTQTVTATSNLAAGAHGSVSVSSFVANANYPLGSWIYDSVWPASTPAHFAAAMAHLVQQTSLQGIHWEFWNEPDLNGFGYVEPALLAQCMALTYPAVKAADPTAIIHGLCISQLAPAGYGNGTDYVTAYYAAGGKTFYDVMSVHAYNDDTSIVTDCDPNGINYWGLQFWMNLALFEQFKLANGDQTPIWWTECNWPSTGAGVMTPQLQAQFLLELLSTLSGFDPINGVSFSQYLKCFCIYEQTGTSGNWGLIPNDSNDPVPAVAILTMLVAGN